MGKKLFVGSLPYETTEEQLHTLFAECGPIVKTQLIMDRETGRSKGFGFVEYETEEAAQAAIQKFNGSALGSRNLTVNEARPMKRSRPFALATARSLPPRKLSTMPRFRARTLVMSTVTSPVRTP